MSDRENVLANHLLSNIQQNLTFLKEQNYITAQAHDQITGILPQSITSQNMELPMPPRRSAANIPAPNPRPNSLKGNITQPPPRRTPGAEVSDTKKQFPIPRPMFPAGNYIRNNEKSPGFQL
jgi:hypothetical protein